MKKDESSFKFHDALAGQDTFGEVDDVLAETSSCHIWSCRTWRIRRRLGGARRDRTIISGSIGDLDE